MTTTTTYAVIPAAGYYGDYATVMSTHRTLAAARKAARPTANVRYAVIERDGTRKGDRVHRADVREV
jgi:hypothetical protein